MRVPLNWLRDYVDIGVSVDDLCQKLSMLGLTVESVERPGAEIDGVKVGKILSIEPHPDADKLVVCKTDVGESEPLQIVCGAKNMKAGDRVPTAVVGATLPGGFKIAKRKMRGVESQGMMCSAKELGLGDDHAGLLILDPETPIGADARQVLGLDEVIIEIEVTPNRNDWAGMIGVAREVAAAYGKEIRIPLDAPVENGPAIETVSSVDLQAPDLCPRYVGRTIQGVKIGPSPDWLKRRLIAAGQRPINNVVDVTNYVLLETGHPLHAFDYDKLAEHRIVVRRAHPGESIKVIDQSEHKLGGDMLVIADAKTPVALAGIMGGFGSEVEDSTTRLFIESAYFNPSSIRKTSRQLNLSSESSQRFQRGADPEMARYAADRCCRLIQEVAGGELARGAIDCCPKSIEIPIVELRFSRTNHLLGVNVPNETQISLLESIGFSCQLPVIGSSAMVQVPSWRPDVSCEADLIEEIGRCFNFENIPARIPAVRAMDKRLAPEYLTLRRLRNYLCDIGLNETITWSFGSQAEIERAGLDGRMLETVPLSNPLTENHSTLRTSLLPAILRTTSNALRKGAHDVKLFETAPVYFNVPGKEQRPIQELRLAIAIAGSAETTHWSRPNRAVDFYDIKGYIDAVLEQFGASGSYIESSSEALHPGERAELSLDNKSAGILGLVSLATRKAYEIDAPVYIAEIHLGALFTNMPEPARYEPISPYPPSKRDLAVAVPRETQAGFLITAALEAGGSLLKRIELFDVFAGKQVGEGRKSVGLRLEFQSMECTLTDTDTQKTFDKIVRRLKTDFEAELR